MGLKAKDEHVTIALTDPHGAALYEYYAHGELKAEGSSVAEGIGQGRITANLEGAPIDTQFRISDEEGYHWVRRLLDEEGLCLGLSSGINVAGAIALGRQLGAGKRVATILVRYRDFAISRRSTTPTGVRRRGSASRPNEATNHQASTKAGYSVTSARRDEDGRTTSYP